MPKPDLLKKYDLIQFEEVVKAVKYVLVYFRWTLSLCDEIRHSQLM